MTRKMLKSFSEGMKILLVEQQINILENAGIKIDLFQETKINDIFSGKISVKSLSDNELLEILKISNLLYRALMPAISDKEYDTKFLTELKNRNPNHEFLQTVEPEPESDVITKTVKLPKQMLSTDKAYSINEVLNWLNRVKKSAIELGLDFNNLNFKVTPKLDGFAAYDDGVKLYTRGNGKRGTDITRVFERGLQVANNGGRSEGPGEVVVNKKYFHKYLSEHYENARNFQASVLKEKELETHALKAIQDKAAVFFPFSILPNWIKKPKELEENFYEIVDQAWNSVEYDIDGVVIEVVDEDIKKYMGQTRHHFRWQLAFKRLHETADVKVLKVIPQTSRSGRVNPVVEIEPTRLSGAMIQRVTAHHYNMVNIHKIGPGAVIKLIRSGEVIPKIIEVKVSAEYAEIPKVCPSCGSELEWDGDYLYCLNITECPAQITNTIEHFFKTLGNNDGFGPANITKMFKHGIKNIPDIYKIENKSQFESMGFGAKQSENLIEQLKRSRSEPVEDWRFLAAFGVKRMGGGNCEKLLQHYQIDDIFNLTAEKIIAIEGFALKTAEVTVRGLTNIKFTFNRLMEFGFKLEKTPLINNDIKIDSPISGSIVVFSGAMRHGSREDMESEAKKLGAKIAKSVSSKTNLLVIGENVGQKKITDANSHNVKILTEDEYLDLININLPKLF